MNEVIPGRGAAGSFIHRWASPRGEAEDSLDQQEGIVENGSIPLLDPLHEIFLLAV